MSMTINLYVTNSNPKSLTKALTQIGTAKVISPTAQISTLSPTLVIAHSDTLLPCNYIYIPKFGRYYFATVSTDIAGRIILSCKVDYLMSWAAYIKECPCVVVRAEQAGVNMIPDSKLPVDPSRSYVHGVLFPVQPLMQDRSILIPQENEHYLLIVNS